MDDRLRVGLPTTSFAGVVGEAITGVEHEADWDGSSDVLVPPFGFLGTEGAGSGDAFLGNNEKILNTIISTMTSKNRHI